MSKIDVSVNFGDNIVPSPTIRMPSVLLKKIYQSKPTDVVYKSWRMKVATTLTRKKASKCVPRSDRLRKSVGLVNSDHKRCQITLASNQRAANIKFSDHESSFKYCQFKSDTIGEWNYSTVKRFCYLANTDRHGLTSEIDPDTLSSRVAGIMQRNPDRWIVKVLYLWELLNYDDLIDALPFLGQRLIIEGIDRCINLGWSNHVVLSSHHVFNFPSFNGFTLTPFYKNKLDKTGFMSYFDANCPFLNSSKTTKYRQTHSFRKRFYEKSV